MQLYQLKFSNGWTVDVKLGNRYIISAWDSEHTRLAFYIDQQFYHEREVDVDEVAKFTAYISRLQSPARLMNKYGWQKAYNDSR